MNDCDAFDHPLDHLSFSNQTTLTVFDKTTSVVKELSKLYELHHNCSLKQLVFQDGVFHITLNGDISWKEKIEQPELFDIDYVLLNDCNDDWIIINEHGELVEKEATELLSKTFKWYPVTPCTKRIIWDWLNDYLKTNQSIYRVSNIFLNKLEGNCKVVVKNIKEEIE